MDLKSVLLALLGGSLLTAGAGSLLLPSPPPPRPAPESSAPTSPASASPAPVSPAPVSPAAEVTPAPSTKPPVGRAPAVKSVSPGAVPPDTVAALFGLTPQVPAAPPADGAPPAARWSVQIGLYPTAAQAAAARGSLFWLVAPPQVSGWTDRRGQVWYTLSLGGLTAPGAADTAARLRQKGWDPVRVTALPPGSGPAGSGGAVPGPSAVVPAPAAASPDVAEAVPATAE